MKPKGVNESLTQSIANLMNMLRHDEGSVAIDEDEQDEIVQSLEEEAANHIRFLTLVFTVFCRLASVAFFILALMPNITISIRCHGLYSSILHEYSNRQQHYALLKKNDQILILLTVLPLLLPLIVSDDDARHWSLTFSNIITMFGTFYVRKEKGTTEASVSDLKSSKYKYKSL